jgi:hypothetical protein
VDLDPHFFYFILDFSKSISYNIIRKKEGQDENSGKI